MARQRRLNEAGTYHHITARGVDRCAVFLDDQDRRQYLALLSEAHQRFGCRVAAFCLMTNHIHLTVRDDCGSLSRTLHWLNGVYAKRFNLKHGRTGHLFERRFWSSMLDSDAYLTTCAIYVHRNPVEAGMVERPEDYRWSSYQSYVGDRSTPKFLDTSLLLDHYGGDISQLRVETDTPLGCGAIVQQLRATNPPPLLSVRGSTQTASTAGRSGEALAPPIPLDAVVAACAATTGASVEEVRIGKPGRRSCARGLAAFIAHRHVGYPLKDIAAALGLGSAAAVSMLHRRFAASAHGKSETEMVAEVLSLLGLPDSTC